MASYKPNRTPSSITNEELLDALRNLSKKLKKTPIQEDLKRHNLPSLALYKNRFDNFNNALIKAGLPPKRLMNVPDEPIFADLKIIYDFFGRMPTKAEYNDKGFFSSATIQNKFGGLTKAYNKLDDYLNKNGKEAISNLNIVNSNQQNNIVTQSKSKKQEFGEPINFKGLNYAPLNENGVIFLFALIAKDLGFIVEAIKPGFPDCLAKRIIDKKAKTIKLQNVSIEFEYESKNFFNHKHNPEECDIIVCWHHNWQKCPKDIEVIELKKEIKKLISL